MPKTPTDETTTLLRELIELQKASIRLQKLSISLQAEALAHASFATLHDSARAALEKHVMRGVTQMRATADRIEAGRRLPK